MLQKADFEGHGFNKEESRTVLSTGELLANSSAYMTNLFYQRKVNCTRSQVMQVLLEEGKLLPDTMKPLGKSRKQLVEEMEVLMAAKGRVAKCKTGIEIHSKSDLRQFASSMAIPRRFIRGGRITIEAFCVRITTEWE